MGLVCVVVSEHTRARMNARLLADLRFSSGVLVLQIIASFPNDLSGVLCEIVSPVAWSLRCWFMA